MKEIAVLPEQTAELMRSFGSRISKRQGYYSQFRPILQRQFSHIIQESINTCISCGKSFLGKSIGPHYKKSKQCYLKKCAAKQLPPQPTALQTQNQPAPPPSNKAPLPSQNKAFEEQRQYGSDLFYESEGQSSEIDLDQFLIVT